MGYMDMIKQENDSMDADFDDLGNQMADAVEARLADDGATMGKADATPPKPPVLKAQVAPSTDAAVTIEAAGLAAKGDGPRRLTAHTQSRLAVLGSFDKMHRDAHLRLQEIDSRLSEIVTWHQLTRKFFTVLQSDIQRANELELSNAKLAGEHKKLTEQFAETTKKLIERESLFEVLKQREATLASDNERLRNALASAKLELVAANNLNAQNETKLGETVKALSVQTVEGQRAARENEVLRDKNTSLSIELDKALKREAEVQRNLEEVKNIHAHEAKQHADLVAALSKAEKEALRLQMALEAAQMKQAEMAEAALVAEADRDAETERYATEIKGLREEIFGLQGKLEVATEERNLVVADISKLKAEMSDIAGERHVAGEKLAALQKENQAIQQNLSAATANVSQLSLERETEQIKLDIHRQECEDLRAEIATLNARIKDLLPYERLYKVTKARQHDGGNAVGDIVTATPIKPRGGRRSVSHKHSTAA